MAKTKNKGVSKFETAMLLIGSALKLNVEDYCDLETIDGPVSLVTNKGALVSVIKYEGTRTLVSMDDLYEHVSRVTSTMAAFFEERGHHIQVVFKRDINPTSDLHRVADIQRDSIKETKLNMGFLIDEAVNVYANQVCDESCYFVLTTEPMRLDPSEIDQDKKKRIDELRGFDLASMRDAQNLLMCGSALRAQHETYVDQFLQIVTHKNFSAQAKLLNVVEALRVIKQAVTPNSTPVTWEPEIPLAGSRLALRWKGPGPEDDLSAVVYRTIPDQIMTHGIISGEQRSASYPVGSVITDDIVYAPLMIDIPPSSRVTFQNLFDALNSAVSMDEDGEPKVIPYSLSYNITADGMAGTALRAQLASILTFASSTNANLNAAAKALREYEKEGGIIVKFQMGIMTWAKNTEEGLAVLINRRQKLSRIVQAWGSARVMEQGGDPLLSWRSNIPGLSHKHHAPPCPARMFDAFYLLPWTRQASPFDMGTVFHRTIDGKLICLEKFSGKQNTWITIYSGKPGSGKSVAMNNDIIEACMMPGLKRLPIISIIDVGVSSRGPIDLLRDHLPENQRHLAVYARMKNNEAFAINPLECSVGFCEPPANEMAQMVSFVTSLITPVEAHGEPEEGMTSYVDQIIRIAFRQKLDGTTTGNPHYYQAYRNQELDKLLVKYSLADPTDKGTTKPTYYALRDEAHRLAEMYEGAERLELQRARDLCHRYAMPVLADLTAAAQHPDIKANYDTTRTKRGEAFAAYFQRNITEAVTMYPVFSQHTRFDLSYARVVSIDLQDVIGSSGNAKQTSLFFQIARIYSKKKVAFSSEDLPLIPENYRSYYDRLIKELAEDRKIIAMDELHNAAKDKTLFAELERDGREARKWGTELCLASQMLDDFGMLIKIATRFVIADSGTAETRQWMREKISLKPEEERALSMFVGLGPGGLTYLSRIVCKTETFTSLLTLTIGPQRLWALTTDADDRLMRETMYQVCNNDRPLALRLLAKAYPGGAKKAITAERQRLKTESTMGSEKFDEKKAAASIATLMANRIMDNYIREERQRLERLNREAKRPDELLTPREIADAKLEEIKERRSRLVGSGKGAGLVK